MTATQPNPAAPSPSPLQNTGSEAAVLSFATGRPVDPAVAERRRQDRELSRMRSRIFMGSTRSASIASP